MSCLYSCFKKKKKVKKEVPELSLNFQSEDASVFSKSNNNLNNNNINGTTARKNVQNQTFPFNSPIFSTVFTNVESGTFAHSNIFSHLRLSSHISMHQASYAENRWAHKSKIAERSFSIKSNSSHKKYFFQAFKDKIHCFFCGGINCKYEDYVLNKNYPNAIEGLNSNFINDDIIASQRPSEVIIKEYRLLEHFKTNNIGLIINLQNEGEHPYCGPNADNLCSSGFSYNPSAFTADGIKVKLSGWKDMSVPTSMNFMLEIVKEMAVAIHDDKVRVLVHCHAGYGRTGIAIACYFLYITETGHKDIISWIRARRKKCVETSKQKDYCKKFEMFINHCKILFPGKKESIGTFLKKQEDLLFGIEKKKFGFVPRIITKCLEKVINVKKKHNLQNNIVFNMIANNPQKWSDDHEKILSSLKMLLNKNNWVLFEETENLDIILELLFDWFEEEVEYVINPSRVINILTSTIYKECSDKVLDTEKRNELFNRISKELTIYEYEIVFQISAFAALINPKKNNQNEECGFLNMLDRISTGLLGYKLAKAVEDEEIQSVAAGLSTIINLLCQCLVGSLKSINDKNINPEKRESKLKTIKLISPKRNRSSIFYSQIPTKGSSGLAGIPITQFLPKKNQEGNRVPGSKFRTITEDVSGEHDLKDTVKEDTDIFKNREVSKNLAHSDAKKEGEEAEVLENFFKDKLNCISKSSEEEHNLHHIESEPFSSEKLDFEKSVDSSDEDEEEFSKEKKANSKSNPSVGNPKNSRKDFPYRETLRKLDTNDNNSEKPTKNFVEKMSVATKFRSGGIRKVGPILEQLQLQAQRISGA